MPELESAPVGLGLAGGVVDDASEACVCEWEVSVAVVEVVLRDVDVVAVGQCEAVIELSGGSGTAESPQPDAADETESPYMSQIPYSSAQSRQSSYKSNHVSLVQYP